MASRDFTESCGVENNITYGEIARIIYACSGALRLDTKDLDIVDRRKVWGLDYAMVDAVNGAGAIISPGPDADCPNEADDPEAFTSSLMPMLVWAILEDVAERPGHLLTKDEVKQALLTRRGSKCMRNVAAAFDWTGDDVQEGELYGYRVRMERRGP